MLRPQNRDGKPMRGCTDRLRGEDAPVAFTDHISSSRAAGLRCAGLDARGKAPWRAHGCIRSLQRGWEALSHFTSSKTEGRDLKMGPMPP